MSIIIDPIAVWIGNGCRWARLMHSGLNIQAHGVNIGLRWPYMIFIMRLRWVGFECIFIMRRIVVTLTLMRLQACKQVDIEHEMITTYVAYAILGVRNQHFLCHITKRRRGQGRSSCRMVLYRLHINCKLWSTCRPCSNNFVIEQVYLKNSQCILKSKKKKTGYYTYV